MRQKPKVIVIVGPTAAGKTNLSIKIAKKFGGEIISADSRQVYKGMNIGTGKITKKEMQNIPHYMINVASPKRTFTVTQYVSGARKAIKKILKKGKIPIIVGGTGFYIDALIFDFKFPPVPPNLKLRQKLNKKSTEELFKILKEKDIERAKSIDPKNRRRIIRALEIIAKLKKVPKLQKHIKYNVLFLGIKKNSTELKKLIKKRLLKRLKQGMVAEVKKLKSFGLSWKRLENFGLEYRYIAYYLQNKISYLEMVEKLNKSIWHYARRQMTWFRKNKKIYWVENFIEAQKLIKQFFKK